MAEIYVVLPLTPDAIAELAALGVPHPTPPADPRPPTPRQVIAALGELLGLEATVRRRPEKQLIRIDLSPRGSEATGWVHRSNR
jgi:hypothetical protein